MVKIKETITASWLGLLSRLGQQLKDPKTLGGAEKDSNKQKKTQLAYLSQQSELSLTWQWIWTIYLTRHDMVMHWWWGKLKT